MNDKRTVNSQILKTIRMTMFICIPATVGLTVLAYPVMGVLFPAASDLASSLLMTGAVSIIFSALCTVSSCALQAIGKQRVAMINAGISLGINIAALAVILAIFPQLDIYAVMLAGIFFAIAYSILNTISMRKYLGFKNEFKETYVQPVIASAIMGVIAAVVYYALFYATRRPFIALVAAIAAGAFAYLVLYVAASGIKESELRRFPAGGALVKIMRFIRRE